MSDGSSIEWLQRPGTKPATWNIVTGCSHVSPGCEACYAERISARFGWTAKPWTAQNAAENVVLHPERLDLPLRWRKPRTVFVNSMSDLFHEQIPSDFIDRVFAAMALAPQHTFIVLTKRPERMAEYTADLVYRVQKAMNAAPTLYTHHLQKWPLPNLWLGVSVEDQRRADERIPLLLQTPAAVRFVSAEPLLGSVELRGPGCDGCFGRGHMLPFETPCPDCFALNWLITGGESGPGARPCRVEWIRSLVEQCRAANVPVFVKQASGPRPGMQGRIPDDLWIKQWPEVRA